MIIRQHIPTSVDFDGGLTATVDRVEDLVRVDWIRSWSELPGFWGYAADRAGRLLVAEFDAGNRWWVVGYMSEWLPGLPVATFDLLQPEK